MDARNQWTGIIGAPKTRIFGVQGAINDKMKLGGYIVDDKYGLINSLSANLSYAYLVKLNDNHSLTFGLSAIINESSFNLSDVNVDDFNDVVLTMSSIEGVNFDAGFGFKYNWKKLEIGLAIPQLIETRIKYTSPENEDYFFDLRRHFNAYLSYFINPTNKKIAFEPSIMFRTARKTPSQLDINLLTWWDQKYWIGLGYRNSGKTWVESANGGEYQEINLSLANSYFIASAGLSVMDNLKLGYAYEISNSNIYTQSNGSHELMLVYTFGQRSKGSNHSDTDMNQLKKSQKDLLDQVDEINNKLDDNTETIAANNNKLDELAKKVGTSSSIEFSGDTAGVYGLIAKIDLFNKHLETLDTKDKEKQQLLDDLKNEIIALRNELGAKSGGTTAISAVTLTGDQNTVYFETGKSLLTYDSKIKLQRIIIYLNQNKNAKIQINGFTDEVGNAEYNKSLSSSRAKEVFNYFKANGISTEKMTHTGVGEEKPLTSNKTYEGRALNRRVEVIVIK